ncbi:MAG: alanyl-tRNA editing protein, partial [Candidatus Diapherotrites archaeon]
MKTEALYMRDCYLKETEATVLDAGENWFVPDKTVFYPEGGGQPSDTGTARWCGDGTAGGTGAARTTRITKAKKEGGIIRHFVDGEVPAKGATVSLSLDWEPRYAYMRYHTAQHLLSAIVLDKYGAETAGNQIRLESARIDFKPLEIGESELQEVFNEFNMWVEKAAPVTLSIHSREDVIASVDERRRRLFARVPEFVKEIRVVGIEGIDKCPCAGTHVSNARELGKIKLNSTANKGKETLRVDFSLSAPEN